eukprot:Nk52_evm2s1763 gene=Nk52_evmTU2s1763
MFRIMTGSSRRKNLLCTACFLVVLFLLYYSPSIPSSTTHIRYTQGNYVLHSLQEVRNHLYIIDANAHNDEETGKSGGNLCTDSKRVLVAGLISTDPNIVATPRSSGVAEKFDTCQSSVMWESVLHNGDYIRQRHYVGSVSGIKPPGKSPFFGAGLVEDEQKDEGKKQGQSCAMPKEMHSRLMWKRRHRTVMTNRKGICKVAEEESDMDSLIQKNATCSNIYDVPYLMDWNSKGARTMACDDGYSSLECRNTGTVGPQFQMCTARNIAVNVEVLAKFPDMLPDNRNNLKMYQFPKSFPPPGSLSCELKSGRGFAEGYGGSAEWVEALEFGKRPIQDFKKGTAEGGLCDHWVEHPVLFLARYNTWNAFHVHEDLLTAFASYLLLSGGADKDKKADESGNIPLDDVQMVLWGRSSVNTVLSSSWPLLFGRGKHPVVVIGDMDKHIRSEPPSAEYPAHYLHPNSKTVSFVSAFPKGTCFRQASFSVYAQSSHLTYDGFTEPFHTNGCTSQILGGLINYIQYASGIPFYNPPMSTHRIRIGILFREWDPTYTSWQSERYIPDLYKYGGVISQRLNDMALNRGRALNAATWRSFHVEVVKVEDFDSFPEQVRFFSSLHILIGAHGAGLMYGSYLPVNGLLLEIKSMPRPFFRIPDWITGRCPGHKYVHYRILAELLGGRYRYVQLEMPHHTFDVDIVVGEIDKHVTWIGQSERREGRFLLND